MSAPSTHPLEDLTVFTPEGHPTRLGTLWAERPAALVFVRHFGCLFCAEQVTELEAARARLEAGGARLVVIGQGKPEEAARFASALKLSMPLFTDPSRAAYCAVGLKRGARTSFNLRSAVRAVEAAGKGFRQHKTAGDPMQQGGVVVVDPGGVERYRYVSEDAGDHPSVDDLAGVLLPTGVPPGAKAA